jgi:hypothetical protein
VGQGDVSDDDIWGGSDLLMASLLEIAGLQPGNAEAVHDEQSVAGTRKVVSTARNPHAALPHIG